MTDFKVGDAVLVSGQPHPYVVTEVGSQITISNEGGYVYVYSCDALSPCWGCNVPDWIIKRREENMNKVPHIAGDTLCERMAKNGTLVAEYEKLLGKMQERDEENINLRIELKTMTGWRDAALEHSENWNHQLITVRKYMLELKEELAAEKEQVMLDITVLERFVEDPLSMSVEELDELRKLAAKKHSAKGSTDKDKYFDAAFLHAYYCAMELEAVKRMFPLIRGEV